jgi:hypothetical protein
MNLAGLRTHKLLTGRKTDRGDDTLLVSDLWCAGVFRVTEPFLPHRVLRWPTRRVSSPPPTSLVKFKSAQSCSNVICSRVRPKLAFASRKRALRLGSGTRGSVRSSRRSLGASVADDVVRDAVDELRAAAGADRGSNTSKRWRSTFQRTLLIYAAQSKRAARHQEPL